ncbi:MAG TPA: tyrosine-type recombinase/integrase, partial [Pyrinomonadaceae bacterium]|nr:tyrosine-type recombinase/integrase [Pyrinomonadaceae bacterium]
YWPAGKLVRIPAHREVKKGFKTALRIAGIEGLRWHDLRATFGTRLGEAGYDAFTIAQLMGRLGYSDDSSICERHRAQ